MTFSALAVNLSVPAPLSNAALFQPSADWTSPLPTVPTPFSTATLAMASGRNCERQERGGGDNELAHLTSFSLFAGNQL